MEFNFDVTTVLFDRITVIENKDTNSVLKIFNLDNSDTFEEANQWTYAVTPNVPWDIKIRKRKEELDTIINHLGVASSQAQNLHSPITSVKRLLNNENQKIYIMRDIKKPRSVIGMLKVGIKRLFIRAKNDSQLEVEPLCVLDFYIHESMQRCGFGHELFDAMLKAENLAPHNLAVDRPSEKCLAFLSKHYGLERPIQQNNNFVVYPGFLEECSISRPPLFLYSCVANEKSDSSGSKANKKKVDSATSLKSLNMVPLGLPADNLRRTGLSNHGIKKKNELRSGCGGVTNMNVPSSYHLDNTFQNNPGNSNSKSRAHEAVYTNNFPTENSAVNWDCTSYCALTPVSIQQGCNQQRWKELQSSWNVLGVKPLDYTQFTHQTLK